MRHAFCVSVLQELRPTIAGEAEAYAIVKDYTPNTLLSANDVKRSIDSAYTDAIVFHYMHSDISDGFFGYLLGLFTSMKHYGKHSGTCDLVPFVTHILLACDASRVVSEQMLEPLMYYYVLQYSKENANTIDGIVFLEWAASRSIPSDASYLDFASCLMTAKALLASVAAARLSCIAKGIPDVDTSRSIVLAQCVPGSWSASLWTDLLR